MPLFFCTPNRTKIEPFYRGLGENIRIENPQNHIVKFISDFRTSRLLRIIYYPMVCNISNFPQFTRRIR